MTLRSRIDLGLDLESAELTSTYSSTRVSPCEWILNDFGILLATLSVWLTLSGGGGSG